MKGLEEPADPEPALKFIATSALCLDEPPITSLFG
jgi:hypothetical protein